MDAEQMKQDLTKSLTESASDVEDWIDSLSIYELEDLQDPVRRLEALRRTALRKKYGSDQGTES